MDSLSNIDLGTMASEMGAMQMTHELMLIGAICSIVAGVVVGMFGLKISRLLSALAGLAVGTVVGCAAAALLGLADTTFVIVVLACAAVFAISGVFLRKAGIFLWILFSVTGVFGMLLSGIGKVGFIIGFVLGLVLAILAIKFFDPLVMISTSIIGASAISSGVLMMAGKSHSIILNILAFIVAVALCIMVQFSMHSRKLKKKEEGQARELREKESREKEIEKARMLLDEE